MNSRKGLDTSIELVMAIVVVVALILILTFIQTNFTGDLEQFGLTQIEGAFR
jgi:hypothetical protein